MGIRKNLVGCLKIGKESSRLCDVVSVAIWMKLQGLAAVRFLDTRACRLILAPQTCKVRRKDVKLTRFR